MKKIIIDTSSAILIFRSGMFDLLVNNYKSVLPRTVFMELTRAPGTGSNEISDLYKMGLVYVPGEKEVTGCDLPLKGGERGCVEAYMNGLGEFIMIDDGRGARFCSNNKIPFVNALLFPKLLYFSGIIELDFFTEKTAFILSIGRYSKWVSNYARDCGPGDLQKFCV